MTRFHISVLAMAVLSFSGCSQAQKGVFAHTGGPSPNDSSINSVTIEHWGCEYARPWNRSSMAPLIEPWSCPRYTLRFSRDDTATYDGKQYVESIGKYSGKIKFDAVAKYLESEHIDDYAGHYGSEAIGENDRLTIARADRTVIIDIYSSYLSLPPIRVRGVMAAIDGLADDVKWKPTSAIDSYLGYFMSKDTNGKSFTIGLFQGDTQTNARGLSQVIAASTCPSDFDMRLRLVGSHAIVRERAYGTRWVDTGPEIPVSVVRDAYGLIVGTGKSKRLYRRVDWREYRAGAFLRPSADCPRD